MVTTSVSVYTPWRGARGGGCGKMSACNAKRYTTPRFSHPTPGRPTLGVGRGAGHSSRESCMAGAFDSNRSVARNVGKHANVAQVGRQENKG